MDFIFRRGTYDMSKGCLNYAFFRMTSSQKMLFNVNKLPAVLIDEELKNNFLILILGVVRK